MRLLLLSFFIFLASGCEGASDNYDEFELKQTERKLGVAVSKLPEINPVNFLKVSRDYKPDLLIEEMTPTGRPATPSFITIGSVMSATTDNKEKFVGVTCRTSDCANAKEFLKADFPNNRRHRYKTHGGREYHPRDICISKGDEDGVFDPRLYFPDVGSHTTSPFWFCIDNIGRCHLHVCDVFCEDNNRLKLYWLIGDLQAKKWLKCTIVFSDLGFVYSARCRSFAWKDSIWLIWHCDPLVQEDLGKLKRPDRARLCCVSWDEKTGFSERRIIAEGVGAGFDACISEQAGVLMVTFSKQTGVFFTTCELRSKQWSVGTEIWREVDFCNDVRCRNHGPKEFQVRIDGKIERQFRVTFKE